jgi:hypothetical protein
MKMGTGSSSETSELTYYPTWYNNPKDYYLSKTCCENLKTIQLIACHIDSVQIEVLFSQQLTVIY